MKSDRETNVHETDQEKDWQMGQGYDAYPLKAALNSLKIRRRLDSEVTLENRLPSCLSEPYLLRSVEETHA